MGTVGIIANPHAGKDLRRLTSAAGQVSDGAKIDIVRQCTLGALEGGAEQVLIAADRSGIAERATNRLDDRVQLFEGPATGSRLDSVDAARQLRKRDVSAVIGLGGDGTCRDLATGWPQIPLIAISTGTNNMYPRALNPTAAGLAAGQLASSAAGLSVDEVSVESKRIVVDDGVAERYALVDLALVATNAVGARAVVDEGSLRWVLACLATPASTGLSSIAGQAVTIDHDDPGAVMVTLGPGGTTRRAALSPGEFRTFSEISSQLVSEGLTIDLAGDGVLAFDGERECPLVPGTSAHVDRLGPQHIDIDRTLSLALNRKGP